MRETRIVFWRYFRQVRAQRGCSVKEIRVAEACIALVARSAPSISGCWFVFPLRLSRLPPPISLEPLPLRPGGVTPPSHRSRRGCTSPLPSGLPWVRLWVENVNVSKVTDTAPVSEDRARKARRAETSS